MTDKGSAGINRKSGSISGRSVQNPLSSHQSLTSPATSSGNIDSGVASASTAATASGSFPAIARDYSLSSLPSPISPPNSTVTSPRGINSLKLRALLSP